MPREEISVVKEYRTHLPRALGSATKVPLPRLRTTSPSSSSSPMACRTVLRLISMARHSSASDGSRSPTPSLPEEMFCLIMPTSWLYSGISLSMLSRQARME